MLTINQTIITATPDKQEFFITREFDAPRDFVFKAYTDPKFFIQWLGPRELSMQLEKFEPRYGGTWRFIHKDNKGNEYAFHGVFHEITPLRKSSRHLSLKDYLSRDMLPSKRQHLKHYRVTGQK